MYLIKRQDGLYAPYDDFDYKESQKIKAGDVVEFKRARNYRHHKKMFALINKGFENQEKYKTIEIYRKVMTILAGYYDQVPSKRGTEYIPHSISYESMSQEKFEEYYEAMCVVVADDLGITVEQLQDEF